MSLGEDTAWGLVRKKLKEIQIEVKKIDTIYSFYTEETVMEDNMDF